MLWKQKIKRALFRALFFILIFSSLLSAEGRDPDEWTEEERILAVKNQSKRMTLAELKDAQAIDLDEGKLSSGVLDLSYAPPKPALGLLRRFALLPFVTHVYLDGVGLKVFPENLFKMPNLQHLSLRHNHLTKLPKIFPPQLRILSLAHNRLKGDLILNEQAHDNLDVLDISHNEIESVFINLISLRQIDLSHNFIENVKFGISAQNLKWLNLHKNDVKKGDIFTSIDEAGIELDYLDLTGNYLAAPIRQLGGETSYLGYDLTNLPIPVLIHYWIKRKFSK